MTVLEQRPRPGGRASQLRDGGYTWDTGPSLITMPWVLEETFAAGGLDLHSEVTLRRLDPLYRIRWAGDERHFDFTDDRDRLREEIARFSTRDARAARRLPRRAEADLRGRHPRRGPAAVPGRRRLRAARAEHGAAGRAVAAAPLRRPLLRARARARGVLLPLAVHRRRPLPRAAIYAALVYLQLLDGGWYADGGVYSLVEAMARVLDVRCGAPVERIEQRGGRVTGVALRGGERIAADVVVSNADVLRTHALLGRPAPRRRLRPTMCCFLLYLGTDRVFEQLLHHTLLVGPGYRDFIRAVTRGRALPSHVLDLRARARAHRAGDGAPRAATRCAILLPVPNLRADIDWARAADGLRDALIADLESTFGLTGLGASVRVEHRMTPVDFERDLGAAWGNAFAVEPTLHQSAYFRQPNRDRHVAGMYHVGGGTHPGAGHPRRAAGREGDGGARRERARRQAVPA